MTKNTAPYTVTVTKHDNSTFEIQGEITWEHLATFEQEVFTHLASHLELDGFRKGNVPVDIARKHIPDELILTDVAERAINDVYPAIAREHALDIIGRPTLSITKLARGNALGFTLTGALLPAITLPDYKALAHDIALTPPNDVTDEAVEKVVQDLRQMRAYGHVHHEGDTHDHTEELPEANDEFAKSFGEFTSMDELRTKIRENLQKESEQASRDKRRIAILEAIVAKTAFPVPQILIDSEGDKMLAQIEDDVRRSGATMDDYLTHVKKTREEIKTEFAPEAEKRARIQLVLNTIARDARITIDKTTRNVEVEKLLAQYPGADRARTEAYVELMLSNDRVLSMLELA